MYTNNYRNPDTTRDFQYEYKMEIACVKRRWLWYCSEYGKNTSRG